MGLLFWRQAIGDAMIAEWHHSDNPMSAKQLGMFTCALDFSFDVRLSLLEW